MRSASLLVAAVVAVLTRHFDRAAVRGCASAWQRALGMQPAKVAGRSVTPHDRGYA